MIKLKTITQHSWIVLTEDELSRVGVLSEHHSQYVLLAGKSKSTFASRDEVNKFFRVDVFSNVIEAEDTNTGLQYFIKGYPVDYNSPVEVPSSKVKSNLPLYAKTEKSETYYSAGFYCLMFPKCWQPANCPKLSTLEKYEYAGPFTTEAEMKSVLVKLRREDTRDQKN